MERCHEGETLSADPHGSLEEVVGFIKIHVLSRRLTGLDYFELVPVSVVPIWPTLRNVNFWCSGKGHRIFQLRKRPLDLTTSPPTKQLRQIVDLPELRLLLCAALTKFSSQTLNDRGSQRTGRRYLRVNVYA